MRRTAQATATIANLGPGFDMLGLCLEGPCDRVTAELTTDGRVEIVAIAGDDGLLPLAADRNCVGVVARHVLDHFAERGTGVRLWVDKGLPLGSGLGSSAASSVASAVAVLACVDPGIPRDFAFEAAREGERLATGTPHPDNVAPALFGGIVACMHGPDERVDVLTLPAPADLVVAVVKPAFSLPTAESRAVLPSAVSLGAAVANMGAVAGFVKAVLTGDLNLLGRCLEDQLATPWRRRLIPGYDAVVEAARVAGALGAGIAGAGPAVFALCAGRDLAIEAADRMVDAFAGAGLAAQAIVSAVNTRGAELVD
jgi:homoserine kinase